MKTTRRKYVGLLLLALFVFPYVQKGIHDLEHASDFQCTAKSSFHLHELSHTCSLCDYTTGKAFTPVHLAELGFVELSSPVDFWNCEWVSIEPVKYLFLLRAPPAIS